MSLRILLLLIGLIIILLILWDGLRRARRGKMVQGMIDESIAAQMAAKAAAAKKTQTTQTTPPPAAQPANTSAATEPEPLHFEPTTAVAAPVPASDPVQAVDLNIPVATDTAHPGSENLQLELFAEAATATPSTTNTAVADPPSETVTAPLSLEETAPPLTAPVAKEAAPVTAATTETQVPAAPLLLAAPVAPLKLSASPPPAMDSNKSFLILHVLTYPQEMFSGQQLFKTMVKYGCRFGQGNLFHRYAGIDERSEIYFSIASAMQPGTFDVRRMNEFNTKGLVFILRLGPNKSVAFDLMLSTAKAIASELNGILCDAKRQPFNDKTLQTYYDRVQYHRGD